MTEPSAGPTPGRTPSAADRTATGNPAARRPPMTPPLVEPAHSKTQRPSTTFFTVILRAASASASRREALGSGFGRSASMLACRGRIGSA